LGDISVPLKIRIVKRVYSQMNASIFENYQKPSRKIHQKIDKTSGGKLRFLLP
jgi:hypothetical protein